MNMIILYFVSQLPRITNDKTDSVATNSNATDSVATDPSATDKPLVCMNYCSAAPSLNGNNCKQRNSS